MDKTMYWHVRCLYIVLALPSRNNLYSRLPSMPLPLSDATCNRAVRERVQILRVWSTIGTNCKNIFNIIFDHLPHPGRGSKNGVGILLNFSTFNAIWLHTWPYVKIVNLSSMTYWESFLSNRCSTTRPKFSQRPNWVIRLFSTQILRPVLLTASWQVPVCGWCTRSADGR